MSAVSDTDRARPRTAVLLVNLGTPDAATTPALRRYLGEFLADPRVVELPRWLWRVILHGVILRIRPRRSAAAYRRVWTSEGSPLMVNSKALQSAVEDVAPEEVTVALAMRYGNPSIASVLEALSSQGVERLIVLPLYPQYSATTTASVFDAVSGYYQRARVVPELLLVPRYWQTAAWQQAVADSIRTHLEHTEVDCLLFSFHGIPQRYADAGDPYPGECAESARNIAQLLGLGEQDWRLCFQSRFGREPWLQPYTDQTLRELAESGVRSVAVTCPGFAVDCLETLEEIAIEAGDAFMAAGGETFVYVPALNGETRHARALLDVLSEAGQAWL